MFANEICLEAFVDQIIDHCIQQHQHVFWVFASNSKCACACSSVCVCVWVEGGGLCSYHLGFL